MTAGLGPASSSSSSLRFKIFLLFAGPLVVAVGAAAPTPLLVEEAGQCLAGREPDPTAFAEAAEIAAREARPITDLRGTAEYRRELVRVLTARALREALERIRISEAASC